MTTQEIKKYVYENRKIDYVLEKIGCTEIKLHDGRYYSACNIDGDNPTAINVFNNEFLGVKDYTREKYFNNKVNDIFTLIQYNLGIMKKRNGFYDAIVFLHEILGIKIEKSYVKKDEDKEKKSILDIFTEIKSMSGHSYDECREIRYMNREDYIPYEHISFLRQGIAEKTANKFGICYSFNNKRTMIPLRYWINGKLLGYNGRSSIDDCDKLGIRKYMITKNYPKQINLYGLWENMKDIEKLGYVTVFEAEKSVLKRDSLLDSSCVALQGHVMSDEQVRIINGLGVREVIIAMDKDVDIEDVFEICEKFYGIRMVSFIHDNDGILNEKDSPADACDRDYRKLFNNRIIYNENMHNAYKKIIEKRKGIK